MKPGLEPNEGNKDPTTKPFVYQQHNRELVVGIQNPTWLSKDKR